MSALCPGEIHQYGNKTMQVNKTTQGLPVCCQIVKVHATLTSVPQLQLRQVLLQLVPLKVLTLAIVVGLVQWRTSQECELGGPCLSYPFPSFSLPFFPLLFLSLCFLIPPPFFPSPLPISSSFSAFTSRTLKCSYGVWGSTVSSPRAIWGGVPADRNQIRCMLISCPGIAKGWVRWASPYLATVWINMDIQCNKLWL